jgi:hypothetical protein
MRTLKGLALALAVVGVEATALAGQSPPDVLYLTGEGASGASLSGGAGGAEWLHWLSARNSVTLGGASTSLGDLSWTYGTVGLFTRRTHVILSGRVSLGSGRGGPRGFGYARYAGSAMVPIARGVYAESEAQFVRLADSATAVFKIGGVYAGPRGVTVQAAYYAARSGIVYPHSLSARAGFSAGRLGLLGGVTGTAQSVQPIDLPASNLVTYHSRECFVGSSLMTGRSQVIGIVEVVPQPDGRLTRVIVTWRLPLGQAKLTPATP